LVGGGRYELKETFVLGPEDSGTEFQPLVFKAFENETPILSGTRRISNFKQYKGQIQKASLDGLLSNPNPPRQLFASGKRQILARFPNFDPPNPIGGGFLYVAGVVEKGSKRKFKYRKEDTREWANPQRAEVFIFAGHNWGGAAHPVFKIDRVIQVITLSRDANNEILSGNRFYFQNLVEELDSPGEWYYDHKERIVYYWPAEEVDLKNVTLPVLETILEIKGRKLGNKTYGEPSYIRFEGFSFEGCEGSAVVIHDAKKVVIARSTIYNVGGNGIEIHGGFDNIAIGNDIHSIGGTGIMISGGDAKTLKSANNLAENNYIHNTGIFVKSGASGISCSGVGNTVSHNLLHSMPRIGIWFDGNNHLIEYNHIHHVNQETQDSGMIYSSQIDWTKRGTIIRHNYLHDSGGYGRNKIDEPWQTPFDTYGIYLDDWTSGTTVYGNIIKGTVNGGIFIHGGRDNMVENNVIIEGGNFGQMVYSAWPPDHPVAKRLLPGMLLKTKEIKYLQYPLLSTITDVQ
jgi:parallel beta-helix repeat protein